VDGVTENDLIMAKVTDKIAQRDLHLSKFYQTKVCRTLQRRMLFVMLCYVCFVCRMFICCVMLC
jgi:hypothetical protein